MPHHQLLFDGPTPQPDKAAIVWGDRNKPTTYAESAESRQTFAGADLPEAAGVIFRSQNNRNLEGKAYRFAVSQPTLNSNINQHVMSPRTIRLLL